MMKNLNLLPTDAVMDILQFMVIFISIKANFLRGNNVGTERHSFMFPKDVLQRSTSYRCKIQLRHPARNPNKGSAERK